MAYALQSLLRIRTNREEAAETELAKARQAVRAAQDALRQRQEELEKFEKTKEERRNRIYDTVMNRVISMDEWDKVQEGVARIDKEGVLKAGNVAQAEKELSDKEKLQETSKEAYVSATKDRMKISQHKTFWEEEEAKAEEFRAESEMEDFTGKKNKENYDEF